MGVERQSLYGQLENLGPRELEVQYQRALDRFVDRLRTDPNVIAVILAGSFAYDRVWYKSDMDVTVLVRDQKLDCESYTLEEEGIAVNLAIYTRTGFRQALMRSRGGGMMHSMYAKAKVVYATDDSLYGFLEDVRQMGGEDIEHSFFLYSAWLLGLMEKVEKWLRVKDDPMYAQLYVLKCADALANMVLMLNGQPPNRESVLRALELDPEFMAPYYRDPLRGALQREEIYARLRGMTEFLESHIDLLSAPALRSLEDGQVKTVSMLAKTFGEAGIYHTFDFLAERGIVERVTQTIRITPKGKKNVEELGYLYIGDMLL